MESVLKKLNLTSAQINSLYTTCPVGGWTGKHTVALLCDRFNLDPDDLRPLGQQLIELEILTVTEGAWLDDD